jgi:hypothetical protein
MEWGAHMDRQSVRGVYSQFEWFFDAPNGLVIAEVAPFACSEVQCECMRLSRFVPAFPTLHLAVSASRTLLHGVSAFPTLLCAYGECCIQRKCGYR